MGRFHRHDHEAESHSHATNGRALGDHSGYATGGERVQVLERILDENDRTAAANRADLDQAGVFAVNLMSSPGAGKTALLRETLAALAPLLRLGVVEGDIETSLDADRLAGLGAGWSWSTPARGSGASVTWTRRWCARRSCGCGSTTSTCS